MDKKKYFSIYKKALEDRIDQNLEINELIRKADINAIKNYNEEKERKVYYNNFILGDINTFINAYNSCEKDIALTANQLNVPVSIVVNKLIEILKYEEYISEIIPLCHLDEIENFKTKAPSSEEIKNDAIQLIKKIKFRQD